VLLLFHGPTTAAAGLVRRVPRRQFGNHDDERAKGLPLRWRAVLTRPTWLNA
jgi:hypothetical protein